MQHMDRGRLTGASVLASLVLLIGCDRGIPDDPVPSFLGVGDWDPEWIGPASFFAPIIYQDVDNSVKDYLTNFAYDGDWNGGNNWDNVFSYPLKG